MRERRFACKVLIERESIQVHTELSRELFEKLLCIIPCNSEVVKQPGIQSDPARWDAG